jgi:hypothetical protein
MRRLPCSCTHARSEGQAWSRFGDTGVDTVMPQTRFRTAISTNGMPQVPGGRARRFDAVPPTGPVTSTVEERESCVSRRFRGCYIFVDEVMRRQDICLNPDGLRRPRRFARASGRLVIRTYGEGGLAVGKAAAAAPPVPAAVRS